MNQDNNTYVQNDPNVAVSNTVLPAAPTVSVQTTVPPVVQAQSPEASASPVATNPNILICAKCGSEMKKESRYCMKCGNLNYSHPDNESMKQYAWQNIKQGHYISGANVENDQPLSMKVSESISDAHPYRACVITNVVLCLLSIGLSLLGFGDNINAVAIIVYTLVYGLAYMFSCAMGILYIKADEPWWSLYVPFYGVFVYFKITMGSGWMMFLACLPIANFIIPLIAQYNLGKKFYKSGWLTLFFPYVMIPCIAFDKNCEYSMLARSENNVSTIKTANGKTNSEKAYGRKKVLISAFVLAAVGIVIYFAWPYLVPIVEKIINTVMNK